MAILFALGAALGFGTGDFFGGMAAKRVHGLTVAAISQGVGAVGIGLYLLLVPADEVTLRVVLVGATAGVCGGSGLAAFFEALAKGSMSVVAPLTAVIAAVIPVGAGLALGERPSALTLLGVALAIPAIALVSREPSHHPAPMSRNILLLAVFAGVAFSLFVILIGRTGEGSGVVPLLAARCASVPFLSAVGLASRRLARPPAAVLPHMTVSGLLDIASNVLFLEAARRGLLVIASVVMSLYPAMTVVLAGIFLHERLARIQLAGLAVAGLAVTLVALG
jgi:drug/metabolite transporter (DMT)-like permease